MGARVINLEVVTEKSSTRRGRTYAPSPLGGTKARVVVGQSVEIWYDGRGLCTPREFHQVFKIGDTATYGGYNLTYFGVIQAIGPKSVTLRCEAGREVKRLDQAAFIRLNRDLDLAAERKRNSEWCD